MRRLLWLTAFFIVFIYSQCFGQFSGPERILLTWTGDPSTSATVTWRSKGLPVTSGKAEIALATSSPDFDDFETDVEAVVEPLDSGIIYYTARFTMLKPGTRYAYRVQCGERWSEWFQFTTRPTTFEPFSFIYLGDAQNNISSKWSRVIRAAYADAPHSAFIVHAGDLINHANEDSQWAEWFAGGSFIHATIPTIATLGNHEYLKNEKGEKIALSKYWTPQFNYPSNGPEGMEDQVYYIDVPGMRIICLNSNKHLDKQSVWLEKVLRENRQSWTMVTFHHPVFSAAQGRENVGIVRLWKPLFDKYKVDLVLQGHDHTYARGTNPVKPTIDQPESGTVYVVSVAGTKMYKLAKGSMWMAKASDNKQLYQILDVHQDKIVYRCKGAGGEVVDAFEIHKNNGAANVLKQLHADD
jgi:acid phosphatase type 7